MATASAAVSRIRTVGLNTGYQIGSQVAPAIAAILAIPFLLRHLGSDAFGIVMIFSTALAYFTMLDLGLGRAATRFIAQSMEAEQPDDLRRYFWGSIILLTGVGAIATVLALWAVPVVVFKLLKIPAVYQHSAMVSLSIICVTIPMVTLMATFRGFLEASGRFAFISVVSGCGGAALYFFPAMVVILGGQLVGVAVALCLVRVGMCAALAIGCRYLGRGENLRPIFDASSMRKMLSFGGWLSVSNIVGTAMLYGDRFLLGACVSMAAVASYGMPLDVINRLQILIGSFCAVLFPLMSRLDGSGSDQFQRVYRGAIAVALSLMTFIAAWAAVATPAAMKLWLGGRSTSDSIFAAQIFLAGAVLQSSAAIAWTALHARGRSDLTAWVHMAEFPLYCAAFYFAATHYGVRGAALAWFGRGIVDFLCMTVLLRIQQRNEASGAPPELLAAVVAVCIVMLAFVPTLQAAVGAAVICCITLLWSWRMVLDAPTRGRVVQLMLRREATRPA
jgi:O-antigen/teichoic acid export membrane protein